MKKTFILAVMMMAVFSANAQLGYWYQSNFIELTPTIGKQYIQAKPATNISKAEIKAVLSEAGIQTTPFGNGLMSLNEEIPTNNDYYVSNFYHTSDSKTVVVLPRIILRLKEGEDINSILREYSHCISVRKREGSLVSLICNSSSSDEVLTIAATLYNHPSVVWCEPAKYSEIVFDNAKYSQQYYLKNTGQTGGVPDMDINVEAAWNIVTPQPTVTVAVIDTGVEHNHEDLSGNVLNGYSCGDSSGNGEPSNQITTYDIIKAHGTACAGIIAANDNSIGIKGVAYDIPILPVNIAPITVTSQGESGMVPDDSIAEAIRWAYQRAEVLNCAWHLFNYSQNVVDAINEARTFGRGGKGSIVVSASGNDYTNNSMVTFPAYLDGVIAVGALDKNGEVCSYSRRGTGLTLMAFGGNKDIVTTDRMGMVGYSSSGDWNYIDRIGGTSLACAQVSGVVALMLSVNPFLTETQVRTILQNTCRKLSGYSYTQGWNSCVGYGLVDAGAAVQASILTITGTSIPCGTSIYSIDADIPTDCTVSWSWKGSLLSYSDTPTIIPNSPIANSCIITNSNKDYLNGYLIATISKSGQTLAIVKKHIDTGQYFSGTYQQAATASHPGQASMSFGSGGDVFCYNGGQVTLTSSDFVGATITYSGSITPSNWQHSGNTITFTPNFVVPFPPLSKDRIATRKLTITGKYSSSCETFRFTLYGINYDPGIILINQDLLSIQSSGQYYTFSIASSEGADVDTPNRTESSVWHLTIANAMTGALVYNSDVEGNSVTIDSSTWEGGVYAVSAKKGEEVTTHKLIIRK